jgi:UDP-N-acetylmuramoyl-tripeptide--D-alanyl-D-alanine ligase
MEPISLEQAATIMGAKATGPLTGSVDRITTDTRQDVAGSLYFALQGDNSDGHRFVKDALAGGAVGAVVDHLVEGVDGLQLVVPNTVVALGHLARAYRDKFTIPVIGITGSVGKTSTKEMIAAALRSRLNVLASEKNYNNELGVPQTLLGLNSSHQAAVIEMGMRALREIERLTEITHPTIGVITNVGMSHIERLGSRFNIARAKREIIEGLPQQGIAVLPADDDYADFLLEFARSHYRVITFGVHKPADFRATDITFSPEGAPSFKINDQPFRLSAPGAHHVINATVACAVASTQGIPLDAVAKALEHFQSPAMRMETINAANGITVLNDAYNAAPDSMRSALETLAMLGTSGRRKVAILGEMRELGEFSLEAHRYVGERVAEAKVGLLVTVGPAAEEIARAASEELSSLQAVSYSDTDSAASEAGALLEPGDIVLVKGSRAMEMEKVVRAITPKAG